MTQSVYSGRNRHHPYAHGEAARLVQPRAIGFGSAPGTPVFTVASATCTENATPTASNKLRVDSGSWPDCGIYCGYKATLSASSGLFDIIRLETDVVEFDTLVIGGNFFTNIGVSASFTITIFIQPFTFPGDAGEPGFRFLGNGGFEVIDADIIELTNAVFDYRGSPSWDKMGIRDGDTLTIQGSASRDGDFGPIKVDPADLSRLTVPGGHGLAVGVDSSSFFLSFYRRCDTDKFKSNPFTRRWDWDFGATGLPKMWQDTGKTIPVITTGDPVRAIENSGSATGPSDLIRDPASTGEATWNSAGCGGYGSVVFDGTVAFIMAAPQDAFTANLELEYSMVFKHTKRNKANIGDTSHICSWDVTGSPAAMTIQLENQGPPGYNTFHYELGTRDLVFAPGGLGGYSTLPNNGWFGMACNVEDNTGPEIQSAVRDMGGFSTFSGIGGAVVLPDSVNEDFYLGRIEGDSIVDWFKGELARVNISDVTSGTYAVNPSIALVEACTGTALPIEYIPQWGSSNKTINNHIDFTGNETIYTDVGGTVPVTTDGDLIASIARGPFSDNAAGLLTQSIEARRPIYKTDGPRGLSYARFQGDNVSLADPIGAVLNGIFGLLIGAVFRRNNPVPTANDSFILNFGSGDFELRIEQSTGRIVGDIGAGEIEILSSVIEGDWYLIFINADNDSSDEDAVWGSPGPEDNAPLANNITGAGVITIGEPTNEAVVDIAEVFVALGDRDSVNRDRLRDYITRKYGALPNAS